MGRYFYGMEFPEGLSYTTKRILHLPVKPALQERTVVPE